MARGGITRAVEQNVKRGFVAGAAGADRRAAEVKAKLIMSEVAMTGKKLGERRREK